MRSKSNSKSADKPDVSQMNARIPTALQREVRTEAAQSDQRIDIILSSMVRIFLREHPDAAERKSIYQEQAELMAPTPRPAPAEPLAAA